MIDARIPSPIRSMSAPAPDRSFTLRLPLAAAAIAAVVIAARLVALDALPADWYGDISTLYEYALAVRDGNFPPGLYVVGVGPLYPMLLAITPIAGDGTSYLAIKAVGVGVSLVGIALTYPLARALYPGRWFALAAVAVAGTGSWFLILSRLGDQHPLPYTLTTATTLLALTLARSPQSRWRAALCGALAAAGWYAYGATFLLPLLAAAIVGREWTQGRIPARTAAAFAFALTLAAVPIAWSSLGHLDVLRGGHFGRAAAVDPLTIPGNLLRGLLAFWQHGDGLSRVNPGRLPHVDPVSGIALAAGIGWWLLPSRRERGLVVVGAFLLMQLPSMLVRPEQVPSAGRTIAAAPFAYLLVTGGLWWAARAVRERVSVAAGRATAAALLTLVAGLNLLRYFVDYREGLPWRNAPIAHSIAKYVDRLPPGTRAHIVDPGWGPLWAPEPKSIGYTIADGSRVTQLNGAEIDCGVLAKLEGPSVLVWRPQSSLPAPATCGCVRDIELHFSADGLLLFRSAIVAAADAPPGSCR